MLVYLWRLEMVAKDVSHPANRAWLDVKMFLEPLAAQERVLVGGLCGWYIPIGHGPHTRAEDQSLFSGMFFQAISVFGESLPVSINENDLFNTEDIIREFIEQIEAGIDDFQAFGHVSLKCFHVCNVIMKRGKQQDSIIHGNLSLL